MTIIYIVAGAIIPLEGSVIENGSDSKHKNINSSFIGISLIFLGIILLTNNLLPIYFPQAISMIRYYSKKLIDFWPVLFIILGIHLLTDKNQKSK